MDQHDRSIWNLMAHPKVQGPLLATVALAGFVVLLIMGAFSYLQMRLLFAVAEGPEQQALVENMLWKYGSICGIGLLFGLGMVLLYGLLISHRVAGPIPRLKRQLDNMMENQSVEFMTVRQYDYLQSFLKKINKVLLALSEKCHEFDPPEPE